MHLTSPAQMHDPLVDLKLTGTLDERGLKDMQLEFILELHK